MHHDYNLNIINKHQTFNLFKYSGSYNIAQYNQYQQDYMKFKYELVTLVTFSFIVRISTPINASACRCTSEGVFLTFALSCLTQATL